MSSSSRVFRVGTRASRLSRIQTAHALERLGELLDGWESEAVPLSSPGDRDRRTDLRASPDDFFTRDLDDAVLAGDLDCAVHSAKDLPYPVRDGLDWAWLPRREDRRDVLVLRAGRSAADLPGDARIGVSSDRRVDYCRRRFPGARLLPIRGNVQDRVAQLDAGRFDAIVTAAAAFNRLGMSDRITGHIPLDELPTPDGQGALALTFRSGDERFLLMRGMFVKAARFVGAGVSAGTCTLDGAQALRECDVCLHDALADRSLLELLPPGAEAVDVGKRSGAHGAGQDRTNAMLVDLVRQGRRVVRLKGGDPGIFGRLAEEIAALDALRLPYRVIPGVSSLVAATTATGMLLTRRGGPHGFTVMTPRRQGGEVAPVDGRARADLPVVLFMSVGVAARVAQAMIADGTAPQTPAAFVFRAGGTDETIVRGELASIHAQVPASAEGAPGLLVVGEIARHAFPTDGGALQGMRVLLTCSESLQAETARAVTDLGGRPLPLPLIRLSASRDCLPTLRRIEGFDWVVLTSPSAVRWLFDLLSEAGVDVRRLPAILSCGPGTSRELRARGLAPDAEAERPFGGEGLAVCASRVMRRGGRVLRLRSDKAGPALAEGLRAAGMDVEDCVHYVNERVTQDGPPPRCDAIFFASSSAVEAFDAQWGLSAVGDAVVCAIGNPTAAALTQRGANVDVLGAEAAAASAITALGAHRLRQSLEECS